MFDPRWSQLADILVNHSTRVQPGDRVLIAMVEPETFPLTLAVYERAVAVGAFPQVLFASAYLDRALLRHGGETQVGWVPELERYGMEWADVYVGLRGARNPHELAEAPAARLVAHRRALGAISALRTERTRWVLVRVPNESFAQQAGMGLETTMAFFFGATLRDWPAEARRYDAIRARFQAAERVRIVGRDTDLTFSTRGRRYVVGDGRINMPDGEIYTAPVDGSAEGTIAFEFPATYAGRTVAGIRLEFRAGEVVAATAETNESFLREVLTLDAGARRIGEFGVGLNAGIDRFVGDILFDEKIAGTVHLALGRAYTECGGVNRSALHWDIVKDLRRDGAIALDGQTVLENGLWLIGPDAAGSAAAERDREPSSDPQQTVPGKIGIMGRRNRPHRGIGCRKQARTARPDSAAGKEWTMADDAGGNRGPTGSGARSDASRQDVIDDLSAAMARLREAVERLREEVEANAQTEWVRAKPELRTTLNDLQAMIDVLAQRAKGALDDLGARIEGQDKREGGGS